MGADKHAERLRELLEVMDVNPEWHMNAVSDGERRRVQIVLGLLEPFSLLLMDEVTVDLDVVARNDLLKFLRKETETRNATILYATHIYDGLSDWPTHVAHLSEGKIMHLRELGSAFPELEEAKKTISNFYGNSPLLTVAEMWLREDLRRRKQAGQTYNKPHDEGSQPEYKKFGLVERSSMSYYNYYTH
jgi:CCR4-NOT complex subunit CAF16